jgi:hypothetical protein
MDVFVQGSLHGVLPCEDRTMGGLKMEPIAWSSDMRKSIALCNDLVPVGSRNVSGHADERRAFIDVEAAFLVRPICLPHATEAAFLVRPICLLHAAEAAFLVRPNCLLPATEAAFLVRSSAFCMQQKLPF